MIRTDFAHPALTSPESFRSSDLQQLLAAYFQTRSDSDRDAAALAALPRAIQRLQRIERILPKSAEPDEFIDVIFLAAREAVEKFDPSRGIKFETFLGSIVSGRIRDELRAVDPVGRIDRLLQRNIERHSQRVFAETGRYPDDYALSSALNVSVQRLREHRRVLRAAQVVSLDLPVDNDPDNTTFVSLCPDPTTKSVDTPAITDEFWELLSVTLPKKSFQFLEWYVRDGLTLKEIGARLGVTESRAAQVSGEIASTLRDSLSKLPQFSEYVRDVLEPQRSKPPPRFIPGRMGERSVQTPASFSLFDDTKVGDAAFDSQLADRALSETPSSNQSPIQAAQISPFEWIE